MKFKVGDRVKVKNSSKLVAMVYSCFNSCNISLDAAITIRSIEDAADSRVLIRFNEIYKDTYYFFFFENHFELFKPMKIPAGYNYCICGTITKNKVCCDCKLI